MIAFKITNKKDFMNKLLRTETFDSFWLVEANISTFNSFVIDGALHYDFFDNETADFYKNQSQNFSSWKDVRNLCFSIIKGTRTPLSFKIVFRQPQEGMKKIISNSGCMIAPSDIHGLYLNIQYREDNIYCTTGTSFKIFTMDKTLENTWDSLVERFFYQHAFSFEKL